MSERKKSTENSLKRKCSGNDELPNAKEAKVGMPDVQNENEATGSDVGNNKIDLPRDNKIDCLPAPVKSEFDRNKYRAIKLANGLRAFLIAKPPSSSPDNSLKGRNKWDQSGFCELSIDVGRFNDPPDIPCLIEYLRCAVFDDCKMVSRLLISSRKTFFSINFSPFRLLKIFVMLHTLKLLNLFIFYK